MTASGILLLAASGVLLACVVRNLLGAPARWGIVSGRVAMVVFAGVAAFFFWKARELRLSQSPAEFIWGAQRAMMGYLVALVLAAASVGVQRRKERRLKVTAPAPSTSGPPAP